MNDMFKKSTSFQTYLLIAIVLAAAALYSVPSIQATRSTGNSCIDEDVPPALKVPTDENGSCVPPSTPTEPQCPKDMYYEAGLGCVPFPNHVLDQEAVVGSTNDSNTQDGEVNLNCTPGYPCIPEN